MSTTNRFPPTASVRSYRRAPRVAAPGVLRWALPAGTVLLVAALIQLAVGLSVLPPSAFPFPTDVAGSLVTVLGLSQFWAALGTTLATTLIGLLISIAIGVPLGILLGLNWRVHRSARFLIDFMRTIPPLAILPLAVLTLSTGMRMVVVLIVLATVWPVLIHTAYGVEGVDPQLRDLSRSYRIPRGVWWFKIVLPAALPFIVTGIRIASTISLLICVGTELVVGAPGIGQLIGRAQVSSLPNMYGYIIYTGLLGLAFAGILALFERRVLSWHESVRERGSR